MPSPIHKHRANLTLSADTAEPAKKLDIDMSQTTDALLSQGMKLQYWAKWREENKEAFVAYNKCIEQIGLPLVKYRTWGQCLSTGKVK